MNIRWAVFKKSRKVADFSLKKWEIWAWKDRGDRRFDGKSPILEKDMLLP